MRNIRYILTTSIKQQRADLNEFRELTYRCASLRLDKICTYNSLIRNLGKNQNPDDVRACVKREAGTDDLFCEKFNPNDVWGACDEQDCPFYQRNNDFFRILKEFEKTIQVRKNFWDEKMR